MGEIGVVEGLGGLRRELRRRLDHALVEPLAGQELARGCGLQRMRCDRAQDDAAGVHDVAVELDRHGGAGDRKIDRAAPPQLHVGAARALGRRQSNLSDDLMRLLGEIVDAIVAI